jgi:serine/threonine protein kinase
VLLGATREAAPWIVDDALLAKFEGEEEIGSGKFASVRRKLVNGKYVAIKGLKRKEVYDERGVDEEEARKTLVHESELVSCLDHPNIIRVTSLVKSSDGSKVFMIQDECEGTIRQVYAMEEKKWRRASTSLANQSSIYGNYTESRWLPPPTTALKLCKELVAAVEYLQCDLKHPMLHRDMCPEKYVPIPPPPCFLASHHSSLRGFIPGHGNGWPNFLTSCMLGFPCIHSFAADTREHPGDDGPASLTGLPASSSPSSCLISKEGILKLSDFGSARIVTNDEKVEGGEVWGGKQGYLLTGGLGSVRYAAPETLGERCLDRSTSESPEPKKNNRAPLLVKQSSNESEGGYMNAHLLLHYDEKSE